MIERKPFGDYELVTIQDKDLEVSITNLGATVTSIKVEGEEILLGFNTPEEYLNGTCYIGALVGRYANRLKGASFEIDGVKYDVTANENGNQLHGGVDAFDRQRWDIEVVDDNAVAFKLLSKDGDNGYPGNLNVTVTYIVKDGKLRINFEGISDKDTIFAPTTHMYFNLGKLDNILDTEMCINADYYLPVDEQNIPLEKELCKDTFDFHKLRKINQNYDHCFILKDEYALTAIGGNIRMDIYTDFPGIQLYTGEFLGDGYKANDGFATEPEFFPNTPNRPDFPSALLRKNQTFKKYVEYRFSK